MTPRDRRHATTRREIIAAAWTLAEEVGVAGISLRDLAGAVGMRAPSLYTYFPSKDAIYDAMFTEGYEAMSALSDEIKVPVEQLDPVEALTLIFEGFIRFCQASPCEVPAHVHPRHPRLGAISRSVMPSP